MSDPTDLITLADAQAALSEVPMTAGQQAYLPAMITAASNSVSRYCGDRDFIQQQYDKILKIGLDGCVSLPQIPVLSVSRIAAGRTPAFSIANIDKVGNQRATVEFACTGDEVIGITYTGLLLTRVSSAVTTTTLFPFATYPTVGQISTAISQLGFGWTTNNDPQYVLWATTELIDMDETTQDCFEGADIGIWSRDLSGCKVRKAEGSIDVSHGRVLGVDGPRWGPGWEQFRWDDHQTYSRVRVIYTAGFVAVPPMIKQATSMTVAAMMSALQTDPRLGSESDGAYSWSLANEFAKFIVPPAATALCWPYVIHHA